MNMQLMFSLIRTVPKNQRYIMAMAEQKSQTTKNIIYQISNILYSIILALDIPKSKTKSENMLAGIDILQQK